MKHYRLTLAPFEQFDLLQTPVASAASWRAALQYAHAQLGARQYRPARVAPSSSLSLAPTRPGFVALWSEAGLVTITPARPAAPAHEPRAYTIATIPHDAASAGHAQTFAGLETALGAAQQFGARPIEPARVRGALALTANPDEPGSGVAFLGTPFGYVLIRRDDDATHAAKAIARAERDGRGNAYEVRGLVVVEIERRPGDFDFMFAPEECVRAVRGAGFYGFFSEVARAQSEILGHVPDCLSREAITARHASLTRVISRARTQRKCAAINFPLGVGATYEARKKQWRTIVFVYPEYAEHGQWPIALPWVEEERAAQRSARWAQVQNRLTEYSKNNSEKY